MILLGTGCEESPLSSPTALRPAAQLSHGPADVERPFRWKGEGVLVSQEFAPGFPDEESDFGGRCSVPSHFVISFTVTAEASHLGRITAVLEHCSEIDFQTGQTTLRDGFQVITAANGDELWATYRSADVPDGEFDELVQFAGGTGRFENASGEGLTRAVCQRATGTCPIVEFRGVLAYDASDRGR
jgi:hypothetical protein